MQDISLKNGLITYYGNMAGYAEKEKAVVDKIFQNEELSQWLESRSLTPMWMEGVMERLIAGEQMTGTDAHAKLKNVRIWQLKSETDVRMKFIGLDEMARSFGEPDRENYCSVYDGQLGTNDLEDIYTIFNMNHPQEFKGHSLSMSDVIELYNENSSEYYFCDHFGFKNIDFEPKEQNQDMNMVM